LEEHTTEDNVAGLGVCWAQVSDSDVAFGRAARSFLCCSKGCKRNAHVVSCVGCEIKQEGV